MKIPWKAIFTSLPYWAIIVGAIGESWGSTFLITEIPTYLSNVTDIDIDQVSNSFLVENTIISKNLIQNSLYSSAPYVVAAVATVAYGPLADYFIVKKVTSRRRSRQIFHGIGMTFSLVKQRRRQSAMFVVIMLKGV